MKNHKLKVIVFMGLIVFLSLFGIIGCLSPYESHLAGGAAAISNGDYDQAIAEFTQVIELTPDECTGYFWRGSSYIKINMI